MVGGFQRGSTPTCEPDTTCGCCTSGAPDRRPGPGPPDRAPHPGRRCRPSAQRVVLDPRPGPPQPQQRPARCCSSMHGATWSHSPCSTSCVGPVGRGRMPDRDDGARLARCQDRSSWSGGCPSHRPGPRPRPAMSSTRASPTPLPGLPRWPLWASRSGSWSAGSTRPCSAPKTSSSPTALPAPAPCPASLPTYLQVVKPGRTRPAGGHSLQGGQLAWPSWSSGLGGAPAASRGWLQCAEAAAAFSTFPPVPFGSSGRHRASCSGLFRPPPWTSGWWPLGCRGSTTSRALGRVSVDLRLLRDLSWYPRYREARHLAGRGRRARRRGASADPETFARCLATVSSGLYENNRWRGVAAAYRQREAAVDGYRICAPFLDAPLRGRRRAARCCAPSLTACGWGGTASTGPCTASTFPLATRRGGAASSRSRGGGSPLGAEPDDMALRW